MNSKQRHEARYLRRKQLRDEKKQTNFKEIDCFDNVFCFEKLYKSAKKCYLGVGWKASTQKYRNNMLTNILGTSFQLKENKFKSKGFYEFDICERGKHRHIRSVHISERVVQRCLCDNALIPIFSAGFIYDNGACLKNKGIDFTINRLKKHLHSYYKKYGKSGYVLKFDFKKYFDNINHEKLKEYYKKHIKDERILNLSFSFIDAFGEKGLGLGSQISQISALAYASRLDHFIKEMLRIKFYGRYMDDGYLLSPSKEELKFALQKISEICDEFGIILNEKKTKINKIEHGISFLKRKFLLTDTGRIVTIAHKSTAGRMRKKIKVFKRWIAQEKMTEQDAKQSITSWCGHMVHCNSYRTVRNVKIFYENNIGHL